MRSQLLEATRADIQSVAGIDDRGVIENSRGCLAVGSLALARQIEPDDDADQDEKDCRCSQAERKRQCPGDRRHQVCAVLRI